MRVASAIAALVILAAPAGAQEVPRYDVEKHCRAVASFGGSYSASLDSSCFEMEQSAYDQLKIDWAGLPQSMRGHCDKVATFGGAGSYSLLQSCVEMEVDATRQNSGKTFKY